MPHRRQGSGTDGGEVGVCQVDSRESRLVVYAEVDARRGMENLSLVGELGCIHSCDSN